MAAETNFRDKPATQEAPSFVGVCMFPAVFPKG